MEAMLDGGIVVVGRFVESIGGVWISSVASSVRVVERGMFDRLVRVGSVSAGGGRLAASMSDVERNAAVGVGMAVARLGGSGRLELETGGSERLVASPVVVEIDTPGAVSAPTDTGIDIDRLGVAPSANWSSVCVMEKGS
jgi:hypothetical protein